ILDSKDSTLGSLPNSSWCPCRLNTVKMHRNERFLARLEIKRDLDPCTSRVSDLCASLRGLGSRSLTPSDAHHRLHRVTKRNVRGHFPFAHGPNLRIKPLPHRHSSLPQSTT